MGEKWERGRPHSPRPIREDVQLRKGPENPDSLTNINTIPHCPLFGPKSKADICISCTGRTETLATYRLQLVGYWTDLSHAPHLSLSLFQNKVGGRRLGLGLSPPSHRYTEGDCDNRTG